MEENVNFDNEVLAYLSTRKDQLIASHSQYQMQHPEIREVLNDFISAVLLHKPVSSCAYESVERHLCLCERILPPVQPFAPAVQTSDLGGTLRRGQAYSRAECSREARQPV